jgi:hypothetical protein
MVLTKHKKKYLFTAVSGTYTNAVMVRSNLRPMPNSGRQNARVILPEIKEICVNCAEKCGKFLWSGNARLVI